MAEAKEVLCIPAVHMGSMDGSGDLRGVLHYRHPGVQWARGGRRIFLGREAFTSRTRIEERIAKREIVAAIETYQTIAKQLLQG